MDNITRGLSLALLDGGGDGDDALDAEYGHVYDKQRGSGRRHGSGRKLETVSSRFTDRVSQHSSDHKSWTHNADIGHSDSSGEESEPVKVHQGAKQQIPGSYPDSGRSKRAARRRARASHQPAEPSETNGDSVAPMRRSRSAEWQKSKQQHQKKGRGANKARDKLRKAQRQEKLHRQYNSSPPLVQPRTEQQRTGGAQAMPLFPVADVK